MTDAASAYEVTVHVRENAQGYTFVEVKTPHDEVVWWMTLSPPASPEWLRENLEFATTYARGWNAAVKRFRATEVPKKAEV